MAEFSSNWKRYLRRAVMATVCMFLLLWLLFDRDLLVLASLGSTAFIVFALPDSRTARPRNVVGGQLAGLVSGAVTVFLVGAFLSHPLPIVVRVAFCAASVGLSVFIMMATETEHPPAAGTALRIAMVGLSLQTAVAVVAGAVLLGLVPYLTRLDK